MKEKEDELKDLKCHHDVPDCEELFLYECFYTITDSEYPENDPI